MMTNQDYDLDVPGTEQLVDGKNDPSRIMALLILLQSTMISMLPTRATRILSLSHVQQSAALTLWDGLDGRSGTSSFCLRCTHAHSRSERIHWALPGPLYLRILVFRWLT